MTHRLFKTVNKILNSAINNHCYMHARNMHPCAMQTGEDDEDPVIAVIAILNI